MRHSEQREQLDRALAIGWWPTELVDDRGHVLWARPDRSDLQPLEAWSAAAAAPPESVERSAA